MEMTRCIGDGIKTSLDLNRENMQAVDKDVKAIQECLHVLDTYWEGPAHDTFRSEFNESLKNLADLIKRTNEIIDFEELAYTKYMNADEKAADRVKTFFNHI